MKGPVADAAGRVDVTRGRWATRVVTLDHLVVRQAFIGRLNRPARHAELRGEILPRGKPGPRRQQAGFDAPADARADLFRQGQPGRPVESNFQV